MRYRTKVAFVRNGKTHEPGSVLPDNIPRADLEFLKRKGFVEPADIADTGPETEGSFKETGDGWEDGFGGMDEFYEPAPGEVKSQDEIRKIRSKKEIAVYAKSIGFDLEEDYNEKTLKELQDAVIDFQEEVIEGCDKEEAE